MNLHTTNYFDTFISVPADCPVTIAEIPPQRKQPTVARKQYDLLRIPYKYTSDELIYLTTGEPKGLTWEEFFSKGQACMRASSLVKRYGWGIHCNHEGKIARYAVESPQYQQFANDTTLTQIQSMKRKKL
ncbi:hypothetical protein IV487_08710 [Enterococcus saccharolyticus]|uniref:Uncharacterized protein n=1 Tax=Candidatus Enterococcus willemsii TaxID=1857215 RepID=A0ABQ6Z128_9ENTE|nr:MULTISPECIES: DUF6157 family protein [Enterococcus]KAF1305084.1 hypothetical protein BAU17_04725 [Enterococcus sp. CU12B]MCD5002542.1 hypothetical protein [Enterococcus saccharolyticus]